MGETILSAPVLEQGAEERDIYLPDGYWKDGNNGSIYEGKRWLRNYPAPIEVLPYFIRQFNTSALFEDIGEKSSSLIKQIYFKRSEVSASIQKRKSDSKYYIKIFNGNYTIIIISSTKSDCFYFTIGNKFVQSVLLNTNFGNSSLEIKEIPNGYELSAANDPVRISITIDIDVEDFSVLNIERKMSSSEVATDCFDLGK